MVATRSGRAVDSTKPRPPMQSKKTRQPAKKRLPVGVDSSPTPPDAAGSGPLGKLPIEILWMIGRALPTEPFDGLTDPRPSDLFPLAITCKGFWGCLRPLLFQLDINFTTMRIKLPHIAAPRLPHIAAPPRWHKDRSGWYHSRGLPRSVSALAFGILSGHTSTAEFAIQVARSLGELESYTSVSTCHKKLLPVGASSRKRNRWNLLTRWGAGLELDPLSLAIVKGNAQVVEILTRGADTSVLSRVGSPGYVYLSEGTHTLCIPMTPLHLAIWMEQDKISKILLQRFAEVDQTTLKWTEPDGLGLASYLRNIKMVRLLLDGDEEAEAKSPWVERIRSQLREDWAYDCDNAHLPGNDYERKCSISAKPPMIVASVGSGPECLSAAGNSIFALLADKNPHLVTREYNPAYGPKTPLGAALLHANHGRSFRESSILALIRLGALEPGLLRPQTTRLRKRTTNVEPTSEPAQPHGLLVSALLDQQNRWTPRGRCQFVEKCWDAALEYHGGTTDNEFLNSWDKGIANALPRTAVAKVDLSRRTRNSLAWKLTTILDLIYAIEGKRPGLAKLPAIREYLDRHVFQRRNPEVFSYMDLKGDSTTWTHLKAVMGRRG